jgi:phenylpropionate dioxygenase-like ring-hydroxylating dioxygenase large terminal subunit
MPEGPSTTMRQRDLSVWPRYEAAVLGFRNYWYPVTWSRRIGQKPYSFRLLGDGLMFYREGGKVYAIYNQCPHRGIPLSEGRQDFPGTWTCGYHGWVYDLETGVLKAALTDGPDSPICGKVRVRTYPVEERAGLVWVWMGDGPPTVPVETDIPEEFLRPNTVLVGRITVRAGNWRLAVENSYDEAHAKYLHRHGALMTMFSRMPAWATTRRGGHMEGPWLTRIPDSFGMEADYPGLGHWPTWRWYQRPRRGPGRGGGAVVSVRMPGASQVAYRDYTHYTWFEPVDKDHHRYYQFLVKQVSGAQAALFRAQYWLYRRWIFHVQFNNQDARMVELMPETSPERLFRPDASITAWRRLCEHARGEEPPDLSLEEQLALDERTATAEQEA